MYDEEISTLDLLVLKDSLLNLLQQMTDVLNEVNANMKKANGVWQGVAATHFLTSWQEDFTRSLQLHETIRKNLAFLDQVSVSYEDLDKKIFEVYQTFSHLVIGGDGNNEI